MEKSQYDELRRQQNIHWWFLGKKEIVIDYAKHHAGFTANENNKIIDVGCGMGLMLEELSHYGKIFGMDFEPEAVEFCKNSLGGGNVFDVRVGSIPYDVPFQENFFDYVFALDVIEHVENDIEALIVLKKLLRPNGKLILTVPALMSMWSYNDELNHHFRRYEEKELLEKVEKSGLKIIHYSFYNSYLYPFAKAVRTLKNKLKIKTSDVSNNSKNSPVNFILKKIFASEKYHLRKRKFNKGVSLIMACER